MDGRHVLMVWLLVVLGSLSLAVTSAGRIVAIEDTFGIDGSQYHHMKKRVEEKFSSTSTRQSIEVSETSKDNPTANSAASAATAKALSVASSSGSHEITQPQKEPADAKALMSTAEVRSTPMSKLTSGGDTARADTVDRGERSRDEKPESVEALRATASRKRSGKTVQTSQDAKTKQSKNKVVKKTVKKSEKTGTFKTQKKHVMDM